MATPPAVQMHLTPWGVVLRLTLIAGLYFGLHAVSLTVIPESLRAAGQTPTIMGLAVAIYIAAGMILDIPLSRFAQRISLKASLIAGALGTAVLLPLYVFIADTSAPLWAALMLTSLLGAGSSALQGPVLGGLASAAGPRSQLKAQAMNATVQRAGGLGASVIIGLWLPGDALLTIAFIGGVGSIAAAILSLGVVQQAAPSSAGLESLNNRCSSINRNIGSALIGNIIIQTLLIVGYSFFPTYIDYLDFGSSLGWLLGVREGGAVFAAILVLLLSGRRVRTLRLIFLVLLSLTTLGLLALPTLSFSLVLIVFVLQGTVIGVGIVLFNIHIFIGSKESNRITIYGITSAVGRLSGVLLPLLAGYVIANWIDFFPMFVGLLLGLLGLVYLVLASRGEEII